MTTLTNSQKPAMALWILMGIVHAYLLHSVGVAMGANPWIFDGVLLPGTAIAYGMYVRKPDSRQVIMGIIAMYIGGVASSAVVAPEPMGNIMLNGAFFVLILTSFFAGFTTVCMTLDEAWKKSSLRSAIKEEAKFLFRKEPSISPEATDKLILGGLAIGAFVGGMISLATII